MIAAAAGLVAMLVASASAHGCTCLVRGPFLANVAAAEIVVRISVAANSAGKIDATIDEVLKGDAPLGAATVWTYNECAPNPLVLSPPGTRWIVAVRRMHRAPGYRIEDCGIFWLRVEGNSARGEIRYRGYDERMSLSEVRARIKFRSK